VSERKEDKTHRETERTKLNHRTFESKKKEKIFKESFKLR
jgi:hypothetical protein